MTQWASCRIHFKKLFSPTTEEDILEKCIVQAGKYVSHEFFPQLSSVQSLSRVRLFATPWITAHQASLSITNSGVYSNPCPSSRWCHPTISSSVVPFSSCPQSLLVSRSLPVSQLFTWGGQSTGVSASAWAGQKCHAIASDCTSYNRVLLELLTCKTLRKV